MIVINREKQYLEIYNEVFCNTFSQTCYVFLCGGTSQNSIRNRVRHLLEQKGFQILYPEDLFIEMLNKNKKEDLFDFENRLAESSDIVCVICESIGSAVELGAFTQAEDIRKKMVVAINSKFNRDNSFITMGPIKFLKKQNKNSVVIYKEKLLDEFSNDLMVSFNKIYRKNPELLKTKSFNNLTTYIAFIPIIIYFYQSVERKEIYHNIKKIVEDKGKLPKSFNEYFNAAIRYLLKVRTIVTEYNIKSDEEQYSLSDKGISKTKIMLDNYVKKGKIMLQDRIRCDIMKEQIDK